MKGGASRFFAVALPLVASLALDQCTSGPYCAPNDPICNSGGASSGGSSGGFLDASIDTGFFPDTGSYQDTYASDGGTCGDVPCPALGAPTFSPGAGPVAAGTTVTIEPPSNLPSGGQLYYTTNGSVPACSSGACTGTLFVGPVQLQFPTGPSETLIAIAHDPGHGFADSPPATAVYTEEQLEAGNLPPVSFNPTSQTASNDFLVTLADTPGATICYTLDGSTPTCSPTALCTNGSTYSGGAGGISINGTVTSAATGQVTVTAIACEAGQVPTQPASQLYGLTVADPTMALGAMAVPATTGLSNVPWPTGQPGLAPVVSTLTQSSVVVADPVSLRYTTTGAAPTCSTGTSVPSPTTLMASTITTFQVIGCKQGYLPSKLATFPLTIRLNAPVLASAASPYAYELDMAGVPGAIGTDIDDSANATMPGPTVGAPAGEILCATIDGTPAACTVTAGVASCSGTGTATPTVKNTGTTVNIVACAPGLNTSTQATATYTLQLAPPFLASTDPTGGALGKPGWDWAGTGLPALTMTLPAGASTAPNGYPYADGFAWSVSQVQQNATKCTGTAGAPEPTGGCGPNPYFAADYYCWSVGGTAACGPAGTCISGTAQAVTTPGNAAAVLPGGASGAGVTAGQTLSVVACDGNAAGEDVFAPSTATSVTF